MKPSLNRTCHLSYIYWTAINAKLLVEILPINVVRIQFEADILWFSWKHVKPFSQRQNVSIRCCVMCIQLNIKIVSNQFKLKYAWVWCKFNDARRLEGASNWYSIWLPSTISHLLYSIEWRNLLSFNGILRKSTHINWNVSSQNRQAPRNKHLSIYQWIFMWLQWT